MQGQGGGICQERSADAVSGEEQAWEHHCAETAKGQGTTAPRRLDETRAMLGSSYLFTLCCDCYSLSLFSPARLTAALTILSSPLSVRQGDYGRAQGVIRLWLRLDEAGNMTTVQMNKMATSRRFQVPLRDLRVLDANLSASYPCAILCREKAMVISMEQIKCIIGTHEIFVLNYDHEDVAPFVEDLQRRLARAHSQAIAGQIAENAYVSDWVQRDVWEIRGFSAVRRAPHRAKSLRRGSPRCPGRLRIVIRLSRVP